MLTIYFLAGKEEQRKRGGGTSPNNRPNAYWYMPVIA